MDDGTVYVPLGAALTVADDGEEIGRPPVLIAVDRETGSTRWTLELSTPLPPVVTSGLLLVASEKALQAIDPARGERLWSVSLDGTTGAPLTARGSLVLAVLDGGELVAVDVVRRQIAWRTPIGPGPARMTADDQAAYVIASGSRVMRVMLADGRLAWERQLQGALSEPMVDRDRVFIGSNSRLGSLWALDVETGADDWVWNRGVFGGSIAGTAAAHNTLYVLSRDMMLRSLVRDNGNQRWQKAANARVTLPPQLLEGVIIVPGENPTLSTFRADTGDPISTWNGPENAILQGAPLVDVPKPRRVSIVTLFRDGRLVGLRPTAMLFKEPALTPLPSLPGRTLPRER